MDNTTLRHLFLVQLLPLVSSSRALHRWYLGYYNVPHKLVIVFSTLAQMVVLTQKVGHDNVNVWCVNDVKSGATDRARYCTNQATRDDPFRGTVMHRDCEMSAS